MAYYCPEISVLLLNPYSMNQTQLRWVIQEVLGDHLEVIETTRDGLIVGLSLSATSKSIKKGNLFGNKQSNS
jgi:hypothetical protein